MKPLIILLFASIGLSFSNRSTSPSDGLLKIPSNDLGFEPQQLQSTWPACLTITRTGIWKNIKYSYDMDITVTNKCNSKVGFTIHYTEQNYNTKQFEWKKRVIMTNARTTEVYRFIDTNGAFRGEFYAWY